MAVAARGDAITRVRWTTYSGASKSAIRVSFGGMTRRQTMVISLTTAEGLTGIGETWINYPIWAVHERAGAIREGLAPCILGQGTSDHDALMEAARSAIMPYAKQAGALGPGQSLLCGLEMALFDLEAQRRSVPFGRLFASESASAPVYASGLDTSSTPDRIKVAMAGGHSRIKFKCGFDFDEDVAALRRMRDLIGPDADMLVDANQAYTPEEALRFAEAVADLSLTWFEEPVDCNDLSGMAWLRDRSPIPIAAGENWYGIAGMKRGLDSGAVDFVQPDIIKNATISEALDLGKSLKGSETRLAFHNFSSTLAVLASVHLAAGAIPGAWVETDVTGSPLAEGFLEPGLVFEDGWCRPPARPGLGAKIAMIPAGQEDAC